MSGRTVLTIGTFDGVHMGHAALVARARSIANATPGTKVVALAFDPHPMTRLRPASAPPRLTTYAWKQHLLLEAGADEVVRLDPFNGLLELAPEQFVQKVVATYSPKAVVEGEDFHFGKARAGNVDTLKALGASAGFDVEILPPVEVMLGDATLARASSTAARRLLLAGRASDAARVLGRPYRLMGKVIRGDRRGRTIGYPTANLDTELLLPADGVYAARATLPDGRTFGAALSVGTKPTFTDAPTRACEAFLLDAPHAKASGAQSDPRIAGLDEYGWDLSLDLIGWVREQVRFHGLEPLLRQMSRDCDRIRSMLSAAEHVAEEVA